MNRKIIVFMLGSSMSCGAITNVLAEEPSTSSSLSFAPRTKPLSLQKASNTITFSEFSVGTSISDQYSNLGIVFGGDTPFITTDGANPTSPVLSGSPMFFGAMEGRFIKPGESPELAASVNEFNFDAGYFDNVKSVRLRWYDANNRLLGKKTNTIGNGIQNLIVKGLGITRWRIETIGDEPAGYAIDNVSFNTPTRTIFTGIFGGGILDVDDDPDKTVKKWRNSEIKTYIKDKVDFCKTTTCKPRNNAHLSAIASSSVGGIVSIGFFMTSIAGVSSLNTPGNSEVPKTYIVEKYKPGDKVYVVGFSAGGGDAQNVIEKLDALLIPVMVSGHIDSVEPIGDDASIPANTKVAKGYYQTQSQGFVQGENNLVADDSSKTIVTNTKITDPIGPSDPKTDKNAYHRNMDNDPSVWGDIKQSIIIAQKQPSAIKSVSKTTNCFECLEFAESDNIAEWTEVLRSSLQSRQPGDKLYHIREQMAQSVKDGQAFQELLLQHDMAKNDTKLKENLTAVVLKVKIEGFLADVENAAALTTDYSLFIAIAHNLGNVKNIEAKQSLIRLVANNQFDVTPGKVMDAVISAYDNETSASNDAEWMLQWVRNGIVNDRQMYVMARIMESFRANLAVHPLFGEIVNKIHDEQLRTEAAAIVQTTKEKREPSK